MSRAAYEFDATPTVMTLLFKSAESPATPFRLAAPVLYNSLPDRPSPGRSTPKANACMDTVVSTSDCLAAALDRSLAIFDRELASDLPHVNELIAHIRNYRGKLLRPRLLLLTAQACGELRPEHEVLAATVEMVHMATLVHDDVLDEADVRRHGMTVNKMSGNEAAVMLGDYLISHAYHLCSSLDTTLAARRIAAVTNTVCEGELAQIAARGRIDLSEAEYFDIIARKTAALTGVCCELGAAFAQTDTSLVRHMAGFGTDLGMAFQIVDDLLDLTGSERETGKSAGRDADLGKMTLPTIRFLAAADERQRREFSEILRSGESVNAAVRILLSGSDAIESALKTAGGYVQSAVAHLHHAPPSEARDTLDAATRQVLKRRS